MAGKHAMPWHLAQSPWSIEFEKFFPEAEGQWDHPTVKDTIRKQALMISYQVLKGKNISEPMRKMAEFILTKFVGQETQPSVQLHLTFADIIRLKKKAGAPGGFTRTLKEATDPLVIDARETINSVPDPDQSELERATSTNNDPKEPSALLQPNLSPLPDPSK